MSKCLQKYRETPCQSLKIMISSCINKVKYNQDKSQDPREYYAKFQETEDKLQEEYDRQGMTLLMSIAKEPIDIIWANMGGTRGIYFCRRYIWNLLGLLLIIFVSTPTVIFRTMQSLSEKHLDLNFIDDIPYIEYFTSVWPTLIIL